MSLLRELQRRNVLRVAAGYIAVSWLIVQVMDTLSEAFDFTGADMRTAIIILAVCFIPVMIISWVFELTPEGFKRETLVEHETPAARKSAKRLDRFVMAALAIALAYFVIDELFFEQTVPLTEAERSIAVLPFVNMSSDPEQEYFSDGISEEMLNLLASIPELRVISRTSAFQYKGTDKDMPEIAEELRVAHILEGSVRKAGNTVRITAQLIHGPSDAHVWSETWDRELGDIFAIQDEIAAQVVDQLRIELLGPAPRVVKVDPEAYTLYLKADHLLLYGAPSGNYEEAMIEAVELLERAIEIEPDYVDALNELSLALFRQWRDEDGPEDHPFYVRSDEMLQRALAVDPGNAVANVYAAWDDDVPVKQAAQMFARAFEKAPTNEDVVRNVLLFARSIGRSDLAVKIGEFVVNRDPKCAGCYYQLSQAYREAGMLEEAEAAGGIAQAMGISLEFSIARTKLYQGDPGPLVELLGGAPHRHEQVLWPLAMAYFTAGRFEESEAAFVELREQFAEEAQAEIAMVYSWTGDADQAFEWLEHALGHNRFDVLQVLYAPELVPLHDDPRWDDLLRRLDRHPEQLATIEFDPQLPD